MSQRYFNVNRSGVNSKLLGSTFTDAEREFIWSQIATFADTRQYVRVTDSKLIRKLLGVPVGIDTYEANDPE